MYHHEHAHHLSGDYDGRHHYHLHDHGHHGHHGHRQHAGDENSRHHHHHHHHHHHASDENGRHHHHHLHDHGPHGHHHHGALTTAMAVDRDKHSQQAVKWAVDHLLVNTTTVVLIHVRTPAVTSHGFSMMESSPETSKAHMEEEVSQLFLPYRGFCARKGLQLKEVVLEDADVSKAIVEYITAHSISSIVVGCSNKNTIAKKLIRNPDVAANVVKLAPDFCTVYVISKGKPVQVRSARSQPPTLHKAFFPASPSHFPAGDVDSDDAIRTPFNRGGWRSPVPAGHAAAERRSFEKHQDHVRRTPGWERPLSTAKTVPNSVLLESLDASLRPPRSSSHSRDSFSDDLDFQGDAAFHSIDSLEFASAPNDSPRSTFSPRAGQKDLEAELKKLKLELKQTMDMYSTACKEAISAKQKARELHQWKLEEARKFEEARQAEEAALAIAEMEKAKCRAAVEAANAAQRVAEMEAQKRLTAELAAKREAEEKKAALEALALNDVRYRKYSIEEIELATDFFSDSRKIGEGGYGPVYKAVLDHTPVAIKVLRPGAAQGKKQFHQEVEVLSRIRHPNMVLLLGACPEYGCLVYEFMDNGSLEDRLFRRGSTPPLPWPLRFKVAAEVATGLLFLHQTKPEPLVHRDLKPANLLLDRNFVGKISDVGLSRLVPPSVADAVTQYRMTATAGTFCYIDPEYQQTGMLGIKSDVYSLGILLLQLLTGRPPMGLTHHVSRAIDRGSFGEMLDPAVPDWPVDDALAYAKLALSCAELKRRDRPDLATVILPELNRLRNLGTAREATHAGADSASSGGHSAAGSSCDSRSSSSHSNNSNGSSNNGSTAKTPHSNTKTPSRDHGSASRYMGTPWR